MAWTSCRDSQSHIGYVRLMLCFLDSFSPIYTLHTPCLFCCLSPLLSFFLVAVPPVWRGTESIDLPRPGAHESVSIPLCFLTFLYYPALVLALNDMRDDDPTLTLTLTLAVVLTILTLLGHGARDDYIP
jgi:hypothetical protein